MSGLTSLPFRYITVAGNIGVGKTSLCRLLHAQLKWGICIEDEESNPYIEDFYGDMKRWGFHSQIHFLCHRFEQVQNMIRQGKSFIQDRSIYEDGSIFVKNLLGSNNLSQRDYDTYQRVYKSLVFYLRPPDIIIYLKASLPTLVAQIQERSRAYEKSIPLNYLARLNDLYDQWFKAYPYRKRVISTDKLDFIHNHDHRNNLLGDIISSFDDFFNDKHEFSALLR